MPWKDAQSFQLHMAQIRYLGVFIVLSRDEFSGAIRLSKDGRPIVALIRYMQTIKLD